jgi:UTP--glucose-1-phosphate uridylyltransferase
MVAIIPAAGKGTRMASVTGGAPKELLRLGGKTVLQRIIEEAQACEPDAIIVVSSPSKPQLSLAAMEFGAKVELQVRPAGLADAIATAGVEDDAIVLFGDCVFSGGSPAARLADLSRRGIDGCIAVEPVDDEGTRHYGIVEVDEYTGGIQRILEKPGPSATDSRWAIAARFSCSVGMMSFVNAYVRRHAPWDGSELSMTPVFQYAISQGYDLKAVPLIPEQQRVDCGSPDEYRSATWLNWD